MTKEDIDKEIDNLLQAYIFTLEFGCLPKHCSKVINEMIKDNKLEMITTVNQKIHNLAPNNYLILK